MRSYRLAQAANGEYCNYHGANSAAQSSLVMTAVVNVINRINEVYEPEVAVRLILVANTDQLFYYSPSTDPYTNNNGSTMLGQNISTCNSVIGSGNYDIGHVFSTGGGGVAYLGSVCGSNKAGGVTGQPAPIGDPFSIDYVAHEMGHQFGGNHTQYNNCNRNNQTAMEPGSASSIMGYAGICSPNVQNNSDAYFHAKSIDEIKTFLLANGNSCATIVSTPTNNPPTITSVPNYSIPISTPFVLTLNATDPQGNTMNYAWDQMNGYSNPSQTMPPASTNSSGPVFRSVTPTTSPSRYFPPLDNVVNNTANTWQVLPSIARSLSFRGVVRDYTGTFGCNNEVNITVSTVNAAAGAFSVTSFNTATTWNVGDSKTVTWNVAGTTASPISASNVDIFLSIDGGYTYPITLATATPNDGSHAIIVPNNVTTQGRIMVKGSNHIFFDINNANITISGTTPTFTLSANPNSHSGCPGTTFTSIVTVSPVSGFNQPVTLAVSGLPSGATANITPNPVTPGNNATIIFNGFTIPGTVSLNINGSGGSQSSSTGVSIEVIPNASLVSLVSPADMATNISLTPTMSWTTTPGSSSYDFEVAYDSVFDEILASYNGTNTSFQINTPVLGGTTLYWRVRANNICGPGDWSTRSFTVEPCYFYSPQTLPVSISAGNANTYSYLNIKDQGNITDLNIIDFEGVCPSLVSWKFTLIHPSGTSSLFWDSPCNRESSFDLAFDDAATSTWPCPPTTGLTYIPSNNLSVLNNLNLKGNWSLKVENLALQNGSVDTWGMKVCVNNFCRLTVDNTHKSGPGSLYDAVQCAVSGDTIRFASDITNDTIYLGTQSLNINKKLFIESDITKNIHIMSESSAATIINSAPNAGEGLKIKGLHIHSSNPTIGAINNNGTLTLHDVILHEYSGSSTSTITNQAGATATLIGNCKIVQN